MRPIFNITLLFVISLCFCAGVSTVWAEGGPEASITLMPGRYATVDGNDGKFSELNWMKRGFTGGIKKLTLHEAMDSGAVVSMEGHALIDQNDLGAEFLLKKEDVGLVRFDYVEFRKYYDRRGGVWSNFSTLASSETDKELQLDIGKFGFEGELALGEWPDLNFGYEREFKDGTKSRLTWASVKEAGTSRKIGPSWQEIEEIVDMFEVGAEQEVAGFHVSGEQKWEFVRTELLREEKNLSTSGAAGDLSIRRHEQNPESTSMTSLFNMEKPLWEERGFISSGYRFAHLNNREYENLFGYESDGTTRRADSHTRLNAYGANDYDSHTWVGHFNASPFKSFTLGTKFKAEHVKAEGNSVYPYDADIDTIIDTTQRSNVDNQQTRLGESLSLGFTGVPRTALYAELEMEQARVFMREDRQSIAGESAPSADEIFNRRTITDVRRGAGTIGAHTNPFSFLNVTAHVRHRKNNNDYDDQQESSPGGSTARSAFMDEQNIETDELMTRITLKPYRWLRPSFRYQYRDDDYFTRVEAQSPVETNRTSHIYTVDLMLQPLERLWTSGSFSRQTAAISATNTLSSSVASPTFNADVNSWLFTADYALRSNMSLNGALQYTTSDNFNNFVSTGEPHGADFNMMDIVTGLHWALSEDAAVDTRYAFYHYNSNPNVEAGDYDAHVVWLEFSHAL